MNIKVSLAVVAAVCLMSCGNQNTEANNQIPSGDQVEANQIAENTMNTEPSTATADGEAKVRKLNTKDFIAEVYDYKSNPSSWVFKGSKPAIIDFYADWCGPCKRVAPIMDNLAKKYAGKIDFYKINTDEESELSGSVFGIQSIPSILFIPANGQPAMYTGAFPEDEYIKIINEQLKIN